MGAAVVEVAGKAGDGVFGGLGRSVRLFVVCEVGLGGEVEVGFVAGAGGDRVAGLLVEAVAGQGEGAVDRGALELVGGQGVAVVDPAGVEIPVRQPDLAAGVELDGERTAVGVDVDDDAAVAVVDVEGLVVAQENDAVAGREAAVVDGDLGVAESPRVAHERVGVGVELGDAAAMQRDQHRLLLRVAFCGLPPVGQLGAHGAGGVVGDGDAAALRFEEDVGVDVAGAQAGERADLLGVDLAAVTRQFDGAEAFADGAEGAAGLDLRQLARVADRR